MLNKLISLVLDFSYELDHFVALVKAHLRIFPDFFYDWQLEKVFLVFHVKLIFLSDDVNYVPIVVQQFCAETVFHHFGLAISRIDKLKKKSRMLGVFVIII